MCNYNKLVVIGIYFQKARWHVNNNGWIVDIWNIFKGIVDIKGWIVDIRNILKGILVTYFWRQQK